MFISSTRRGRAVSLTTLLKNSRGQVFVDMDADVRVPTLSSLLNLFNNMLCRITVLFGGLSLLFRAGFVRGWLLVR